MADQRIGYFTGFSFGDYYSKGINIVRVSGGDRYSDVLHPEIKDRTVEIPGMDGQYYFGSDYGTRTIDIEIAFDSLTEINLRELRAAFATKNMQRLIFDESPYKYYMAKVASPIELSYICFDEKKYSWTTVPGAKAAASVLTPHQGRTFEYKKYDGTIQRIYKGEGKISFICYFPFAKSNFRVLPNSSSEYYAGLEEWRAASRILNSTDRANVDVYNNTNGQIYTYNAGDVSTGFRLYFPKKAADIGKTITINYYKGGSSTVAATSSLQLKPITLHSDDVGFLVDSYDELIKGVSRITDASKGIYATSGRLYNQYIQGGHFFRLEPNETTSQRSIVRCLYGGGNDNSVTGVNIYYDYLYF